MSTGRCCSTCPGARRRSAPSRSTAELPRSLIELPEAITGAVDDEAYRSLAARDLERGQGTALPSGEAVARLLGADALTVDEVGLAEHGWQGETPLWLYILRESSVRHGGERLGAVGGTIVGEVLLGVSSRSRVLPRRRARLVADAPRPRREFRLADLLVP